MQINPASTDNPGSKTGDKTEKKDSLAKWIENQKKLTTIILNDRNFLDHISDGRAQLTGFYKDNILYKIVEWIGLSYGITTDIYYLWENNFVLVIETQKSYREQKDEYKLKIKDCYLYISRIHPKETTFKSTKL